MTDDAAIAVDKDGLVFDSDFCAIALPDNGGGQIQAADTLPYPIFVATISDGDKDKKLGARRWGDPVSEVVPLADRIF